MKYILFLLFFLVIENTNQILEFDSTERKKTNNYSMIDNKEKIILKERKIFNSINKDGFICNIYNSIINKKLVLSSIRINNNKNYINFLTLNTIKNIAKSKLGKNKFILLKELSILINNIHNVINISIIKNFDRLNNKSNYKNSLILNLNDYNIFNKDIIKIQIIKYKISIKINDKIILIKNLKKIINTKIFCIKINIISNIYSYYLKRNVFKYYNNISLLGKTKANNSSIKKHRKLQINSKYIIIAKAKGQKGETIKFIKNQKPNNVYINNSSNSKGSINSITLDEDGEITIKMVWNKGPTYLYQMFGYCNKIISLDLSDFETKGVTTFSHMFVECSSLEYVNFPNINMNSANEFDGMFKNCKSLKRLDLPNLNAPKVSNMGLAFGGCYSLTSIDLSNFYAPKMTKFALNNPNYVVFKSCVSLFINMSHFNAESITNFNLLFDNCKTSLSIDLSYSNLPKITNMNSFFKNYKSLKYINLSNIRTSVSKMNNMFSGCSSLENIDLTDFNTSSLTQLSSIFSGCSSLKSIDLSKFDISNVQDMSYIFYNCISLKTINLANFNGHNIVNMNYSFSGCKSLTFLNLSEFYSLSLKHMSSMFSNCNSLIILDLSNFKANNIISFLSVFDNCTSLRYINLYNYEGDDIFFSLSNKNNDFNYCMKANELKNNSNFSLYNFINNCSETCYNTPIIINEIDKKCYINCLNLGDNLFCNYDHTEIISIVPDNYYLNSTEKAIKKCYSTCKKCNKSGDENVNNCLACIENYTFVKEPIYHNNCFEECPYFYFDSLNIFHCIKNISLNETINYMNSFIKNKDFYEPYFLNGDYYSIIIKSINDYFDSKNKIDFVNCENIIKNKYPEKEFIFVQFDLENHNEKCLTDKVEYEVYNTLGEKVDLSICDNVKINIEHKINNISLLDIEKIKKFQKKGVDILKIEDDFFKDICFPYSDENSNSDMILNDRVNDIYQNYSLCEEGCEYEFFDVEKISVTCNCNIKTKIDPVIKKGEFKSYFVSPFLDSNFGVIKCYKLVFSFNRKLKNIGFWILMVMNIINFISFLFYCHNGINPVKNYINKEMNNKGYNSNGENNNKTIKYSRNETTEQNINDNTQENFYKKKNLPKKTSKFKKKTLNNTPKKNLQYKDDILFNDDQEINFENGCVVLSNGKFVKDYNISSNRDILKSKKEENNIEQKKEENLFGVGSSIKNNKKKTKYSKVKKRKVKKVINSSTNIPKLKLTNKNNNLSNNQINDIKSETKKNNNNKKMYRNLSFKCNNNLLSGLYSNDNNDNIIKKKKMKYNIKKGKNDIQYLNKENKYNKEDNEFPLILINANNIDEYIPFKSNYILNNYNFEEAIIYDKRSLCRVLFIFLISKDNMINIIFFNPPLELKPLRINIFIFKYACDFGLNALFFLSDKISDKYHYTGVNKLIYTLINNITISLSSMILSSLLLTFFQKLTQSNNKLENLFKTQDNLLKLNKKYKVKITTIIEIKESIKKIMKNLKLKIVIFINVESIFMLFFFYYVTAFCHVYESTQVNWILDSVSSYVISFIISLIISFICSILYIIAIRYKIKILYKILKFIYSFG